MQLALQSSWNQNHLWFNGRAVNVAVEGLPASCAEPDYWESPEVLLQRSFFLQDHPQALPSLLLFTFWRNCIVEAFCFLCVFTPLLWAEPCSFCISLCTVLSPAHRAWLFRQPLLVPWVPLVTSLQCMSGAVTHFTGGPLLSLQSHTDMVMHSFVTRAFNLCFIILPEQ